MEQGVGLACGTARVRTLVLKNLGQAEQTEPLTCLCSWPLTLLLGVNNIVLGD